MVVLMAHFLQPLQLMEDVEHHVAMEELMFPQVEKRMGGQLMDLGQLMSMAGSNIR